MQTQTATCMKYDAATHQFIYGFKLGSKTGSATISVNVAFPDWGGSQPPAKSQQITIVK